MRNVSLHSHLSPRNLTIRDLEQLSLISVVSIFAKRLFPACASTSITPLPAGVRNTRKPASVGKSTERAIAPGAVTCLYPIHARKKSARPPRLPPRNKRDLFGLGALFSLAFLG